MRASRRSSMACYLVVVVTMAASLAAQPAATYKTGTEFYMAYRDAVTKAQAIDEILPWLAKSRLDMVAKTPPHQQAEMFGLIKAMDDRTEIKVVKETPSATGADLEVEATSVSSKSKATGVITLVKEGGAWKLERENWKGGL